MLTEKEIIEFYEFTRIYGIRGTALLDYFLSTRNGFRIDIDSPSIEPGDMKEGVLYMNHLLSIFIIKDGKVCKFNKKHNKFYHSPKPRVRVIEFKYIYDIINNNNSFIEEVDNPIIEEVTNKTNIIENFLDRGSILRAYSKDLEIVPYRKIEDDVYYYTNTELLFIRTNNDYYTVDIYNKMHKIEGSIRGIAKTSIKIYKYEDLYNKIINSKG